MSNSEDVPILVSILIDPDQIFLSYELTATSGCPVLATFRSFCRKYSKSGVCRIRTVREILYKASLSVVFLLAE